MRIAIIDLGTNSIRFDVHEIKRDKKAVLLHREKLMVRLGQDVFLTGKLHPDAIQRTLQALLSFRESVKQLQVQKTIAFGTSALRESKDADMFLRLVKSKTGFEIKILLGEEEGKLIAKAVEGFERKIPAQKSVLCDIGGGSTECTLFQKKKYDRSVSLRLGVARLDQLFFQKKNLTLKSKKKAISELRSYIQTNLSNLEPKKYWVPTSTMVGSSGTMKAIWKIAHAHSPSSIDSFTTQELKKIVKKIQFLEPHELLLVPGMEPKRIDLILAGAILLEELVKFFRCKKVQVTEYALRDGILLEEIELFRERKKSRLSFHYEDHLKVISKLGLKHKRAQISFQYGDEILSSPFFKSHFTDQEKSILLTTLLLRKIGKVVSPANYDSHSFYIIMEGYFPHMLDEEQEIIAHLCLFQHDDDRPKTKHLPFLGQKMKYEKFMKLLSVLKVIDALDIDQAGYAKSIQVKYDRKKITLHLQKTGTNVLEKLRLEKRKRFFTQYFKKDIQIL